MLNWRRLTIIIALFSCANQFVLAIPTILGMKRPREGEGGKTSINEVHFSTKSRLVPKKIIAIGELNGQLYKIYHMLKRNGITDGVRWIAKDVIVIQLVQLIFYILFIINIHDRETLSIQRT